MSKLSSRYLKLIYFFYFIPFVLLGLAIVIGYFDTTTELYPFHERIDQLTFIGGIVCGLITGIAGLLVTKNLNIIRRIMLPLVFAFMAWGSTFLLISNISSLIVGRIDFPRGETRIFHTLMKISRAYQTHGKSSSQYVQTMPYWSNLEITREDFSYMRSNRGPNDDGRNQDEIRSNGYFCVKVALEQSAKALRILNAGNHRLPMGSVIVCPTYPEAVTP